jgi:hypothetical protein
MSLCDENKRLREENEELKRKESDRRKGLTWIPTHTKLPKSPDSREKRIKFKT